MNQVHQDELLNDVSRSSAESEGQPTPGRRNAVLSLGAAALAVVAGGRVASVSAAKKKKAKKAKLGRITVIEDNQTVQPGQWNEGFAQCPAGQRVISGGGYLDNDLCVLTGSQQAVVLPETWFAGGRCPAGQTSNIRVTALCIAG
jgi:hypothetical protein